ncbi:Dynamin-2A [Citrus sinensis]|uniref:Dynamin-2A n=1 Tax=Citrus sinensis TaxID=2711 RepID=A0ACB8K7Y7_CITSI|nr:Dynamin-2A [Citrus sinensis]
MEAIEELAELSESMKQAAAVLADEDVDDKSSSSKRSSTFLNVLALGNVGAGKSAILNSLIGHPILPTGGNGATRAPIRIDLNKDGSLSSQSIVLLIDNKSQDVSPSALRHSLQTRLSQGVSRDEIYLKLRTSSVYEGDFLFSPAPPLKLIDLPGSDQRIMDDAMISKYVERSDAVLLVIIPATQTPDVSSYRALRIAKEHDADSTRTVGIISKMDQAEGDSKALAAVRALLLNQGPPKTSDIPWVAVIGQSVAISSVTSSGAAADSSLEAAWRAEVETLKRLLSGAPQNKLGRVALVDTIAGQIRNRMSLRVPKLLSGYMLISQLIWLQGKSQIVQDELLKLGDQILENTEGTKALALQLCREFEDKFLQHITGDNIHLYLTSLMCCPAASTVGFLDCARSRPFFVLIFIVFVLSGMHLEVGVFEEVDTFKVQGNGWKVVASFEGNFPNRMKQLPLDRHFDMKNVKRVVLEADGYQPYLISPEKGLRSLIKSVLEMAKEPSRLCVDEVHRVLVDIVSAAANATPGLGRYPPFKREVVEIASAALDRFKSDAKKMVVALVDMERVFVPPQHFIRLVQRRGEE